MYDMRVLARDMLRANFLVFSLRGISQLRKLVKLFRPPGAVIRAWYCFDSWMGGVDNYELVHYYKMSSMYEVNYDMVGDWLYDMHESVLVHALLTLWRACQLV
jgi:hypothetical protein